MKNITIINVSDELFEGPVTKEVLGVCSVENRKLFEKNSHCFLLPKSVFYPLKTAVLKTCPAVAFHWEEVTLAREQQFPKWGRKIGSSPEVFFLPPFPAFADKLHFISSFYEILLDFCSTESGMHNLILEKQIVQLSSLYKLDYNSFIKAAKYMYAFPLAVLMKKSNKGNDQNLTHLPPKPSFLEQEGVQLRGPLRRLYRNRMQGQRAISFCFSILQGVKRGCSQVSDSLFASTFAKHMLDLSAKPEHSIIWGDSVSIMRDVVDQVFGSVNYTKFSGQYWNSLMTKEISQSASYGSLRSQGGSRQEVLEKLGETSTYARGFIPVGDHSLPYRIHSHDSILHSMNNKSVSNYSYGRFSLQDIREFPKRNDPQSTVMVAGIAEPLKVRTITKGDAISNFYSAPIQREIWSRVQERKPFQLIGKVLDSSLLFQLEEPLLSEYDQMFNFDLYVSGDYSAATDNLNVEASREIFGRIKEHLLLHSDDLLDVSHFWDANLFDLNVRYPRVLKKMFGKVYGELWNGNSSDSTLTAIHPFILEYQNQIRSGNFDPQTFEYLQIEIGKNKIGINHVMDSPVQVTMRNGQLMGSVLSFPILCLANISCYLESIILYYAKTLSLHRWRRNSQVEKFVNYLFDNFDSLPVLINGDDIAFKTNHQHYLIWESLLPKYGFTPSQGKNYVSPSMVTINSQMFSVSRDQLGGVSFHEHFYLNVGLLRGPNAGILGQRRDILTDMPLSEFYSRSVLSSSNPQRSHRRFIHYNKVIISRITRGGRFNLFASQQLCGFGFSNRHRDTTLLSNDIIPIFFTNPQRNLGQNIDSYLKRAHREKDLDKIPKITFTKDDVQASYAFHSSANANRLVQWANPYDIPISTLKVIKPPKIPGHFQPGTFISNQQSSNGHFVIPPEKKVIPFQKDVYHKFTDQQLIDYRIRFYEIVGSESGVLLPKTVSSPGDDLSEPYEDT